MDDFGGKLRQARERRGISLRQIAASTKIAAAALEALERNDVSKLPGGIFSRAFVRSYAVEVGLNPEDTVREFVERFHQEAPPSTEAIAAAIPEQERTFHEQQRKAARTLTIAGVSLVVVLATAFFILRNRSKQAVPVAEVATARESPPPAADQPARATPPPSAAQPTQTAPPPGAAQPTQTPAAPAQSTQRPPAAAQSTQKPAAAGQSTQTPAAAGQSTQTPPAAAQPSRPAPPIEPQPKAPAPSESAATASTPVVPAGLKLDIHPTADCWVSLTVDGTKVFARLVKAGERESHTVEQEAVVEIGDAGAFAFSLNGRPGKPIGDSGQVVTLRLTPATASEYVR